MATGQFLIKTIVVNQFLGKTIAIIKLMDYSIEFVKKLGKSKAQNCLSPKNCLS